MNRITFSVSGLLRSILFCTLCIMAVSLSAQESSNPKVDNDNSRFDNAMQLYNLKQYDKALSLFGEYLEVFSEGAHRKDAYRYIGDIYLSRFDYPRALKYYSLLYEEFSTEEDGVGGYFQMGVCNSRMGRGEKAIEIFRDIIEQFPASRYAQKAKAQLDLEEIVK